MSTERETTSRSLDVFSQTPGAILYRGPEGWRALEPGTPGQVLAIGDDRLPYWAWRDELPTSSS